MNKVKVSILFLLLCCSGVASAQTADERLSALEDKLQSMTDKQKYAPQIHGILRGKYEYQPDLDASRFEVRNARISVESPQPASTTGEAKLLSAYKLEIDLCDESQIKMKDAWVRLALPLRKEKGGFLRATIGQQRMPFSIDAHRNPSAQYFANRSFIAKQVGDMRDVGFMLGYDILNEDNRKLLSIDAGIFNGSNLDNQKTAWFSSSGYSARIQYYPVKGLAIVPSIQHQQIADRKASYTSMDFGAYYEKSGFHFEAEYLRKFYAHDAFDDCNAIDAMAIYKMPMKNGYFNGISYLLRYDYMDNHSDGKKGFKEDDLTSSQEVTRKELLQSDAERHRLTAGVTFHVSNRFFPTDIRLNYEKYWYPHNGTPKESEQDKLVCELAIKF